ncbi:MAG: hypothetical protein P4L39_08550 [Humidesulfovibrio sp.]|nr:hypothetical protein [Humidesulfovibrio sp.]
MRISGYGAGFGQSSENRDRAAAFRARHSIGQRVKGRILRREQNGLYWVQVGGEELLARLEVHADPGDQLVFIVRALTPEIMLQALTAGMDAGDLPGLVQRFRSAREVFETQGAAVFTALAGTPPQSDIRREAFALALSKQPDSVQHFAKIQEYLTQINSMAIEQGAQALYEPWLLPGLRRQEMLRRAHAGGGVETALSAVDASCGGIEARFITGPAVRLSVTAERPESAGVMLVELAAVGRELLGQEPQLLGPTRHRPSALGGVLGELFGDVPAWSSGGLNTRV